MVETVRTGQGYSMGPLASVPGPHAYEQSPEGGGQGRVPSSTQGRPSVTLQFETEHPARRTGQSSKRVHDGEGRTRVMLV